MTICAFLGIQNLCDRLPKNNEPIQSKFKKPEQDQVFPTARVCPGLSGLLNYPLGRFAPYLERLCFRLATPGGIQRPTNNVVTNARQILYTAPTNQDDGVFLQIVADTRDVRCYFDPIGQTHTCNFAKGRIRLLWRLRVYASTYASFLRSTPAEQDYSSCTWASFYPVEPID